jgi:hypothetical protein
MISYNLRLLGISRAAVGAGIIRCVASRWRKRATRSDKMMKIRLVPEDSASFV